jgi:hypothetical protein
MRTRVVHCRREPYDVYIGRAVPRFGLGRSLWANPFAMTRGASRAQVIEAFETWIVRQPQRMARIGELRGKVLGCWCKPKPCHGDTLARLADESARAPV